MSGSAAAWWRTYFDETWLDLHLPLFPEEESRREVAAMLELLGLPVGARVLDAPCGWGRHTVLLREARLDAWGVDVSHVLLRRVPRGAPSAAADLRDLPFGSGSFDGVVNVFTSLGLFLEDAEDLRVLGEVRRVLRPGGRFLLESMHRDDVVAHYVERDAWELPDGTGVRVRRRFDPVTGVSHERLRWRRGDRSGEKRHAMRLRTATELRDLLEGAGFSDLRFHGGWHGERLTHRSPRVVALATAP